jgi:hypothetical protein
VAGHGARPGDWARPGHSGQAAREELCTGTCYLSFLGSISGTASERERQVCVEGCLRTGPAAPALAEGTTGDTVASVAKVSVHELYLRCYSSPV